MWKYTLSHWKKKYARPSRKLVHDRLPVPPSQYALLLSSSLSEPGIVLQQSKADGMYRKNDANSRSRLQVRRAWSELRGVVDTRVSICRDAHRTEAVTVACGWHGQSFAARLTSPPFSSRFCGSSERSMDAENSGREAHYRHLDLAHSA